VPASSVGPKRLTEEILDRVALERSRRKSVKWKELAALVEREFDVCLHPRTIERALRRRKAEAAESAADSSDAASA
jgi:transposase